MERIKDRISGKQGNRRQGIRKTGDQEGTIELCALDFAYNIIKFF